jgi:hypothetical protein
MPFRKCGSFDFRAAPLSDFAAAEGGAQMLKAARTEGRSRILTTGGKAD